MAKILSRLNSEKKKLQEEVQSRVVGYIAVALGLVAGLAWNEAIKALIESLFPLGKDSVLAKFIYAILITIVVVVITTFLIRMMGSKTEKK